MRLRFPRAAAGRARLAILTVLALLTVATWTLTLSQARQMDMDMGIAVRGGLPAAAAGGMSRMAMSGLSAAGWSVHETLTFLGAWTVMMVAMMLPAIAPMLVLFGTIQAGRGARGGTFAPTWMFAAGYFVVWTAIGLVTYAVVQAGSDLATGAGVASRTRWAPIALGATVALAGLYQLTPLKRICLGHCRSPMGFVMAHWRDGALGALRMGIHHGMYCLGCCWALFAVLVAAGVMSMGWMVLLTLVVFVEKVMPHGDRAAIPVGIALIVLGALVATGTTALPWIA